MHWQALTFSELSREQLYAILRLRQEVFVVEQDCVFLDLDNLDQGAIHMLCLEEEKMLAYQRCIAPGSNNHDSLLGRIVVCPSMRNKQLGRELVQRGYASCSAPLGHSKLASTCQLIITKITLGENL